MQTEPLHSIENDAHGLIGRSLPIGVLDSQNELASMTPRIEPTEKGGTHASQVEKACRAWSKASYDCHAQYSHAKGTAPSWGSW